MRRCRDPDSEGRDAGRRRVLCDAARGDVDPHISRIFGFSLKGIVSREWIWLLMTCMVSFRPK